MKLQEAYNLIEGLQNKTTKKYEINIYEKFLHILTGLKNRDFAKDEIQSLETELDSLNLESNTKNRRRYLRKALNKFEKKLADQFSLTAKDYYTRLWIALGSSFGMLLGVVFLSSWDRSLGISVGLIGGVLVGRTIGQFMDAKASREGRVF